jgi:signal transduction histidine kinase
LEFNLATTLSFSAAATCLSLAVLGAYLGRGAASRHFLHAATAGVAAAAYCLSDAVLAARLSIPVTVWVARVSMIAVAVHGSAWLAFLAAWDRRRPSRVEKALIVASAFVAALCLVPELAVKSSVTERVSVALGVTYRDPEPGPLASPLILVVYIQQLVATAAALRMSRSNPKALVVALGLGLICVASMFDGLTSLRITDLPYMSDPALALALLSIGSVVVADAAESAKKSAELERARVVLAERENLAAVGQLAAVVAHEVRNPVAIIFSALASLQRGERNEEDGKLLGIVGEEADRLKQLVTRLLDAVRPFELQYTRQAAARVVRSAVTQVTAGTGVAPTEVELVSAPSDEVECDEILLGQAISNLVQNALIAEGRASPVRVTVSVEQEPQTMLRVEVADDGNGVSVEARPRLFTPFFTTRATGTGLGLALVKRIAGAHGGTVDFAPPPLGRGATFVLRVPMRARNATPRHLLGADVQ